MPGLKGAIAGGGKTKAINNIHEIMDRRQQERGLGLAENIELVEPVQSLPVLQLADTTEEELEKTEIGLAEEISASGQMYTKIFEAKVGPRIQRRYEETREMPRVHREFYVALCEEMGTEKKKAVILQPILERLRIARSVSSVILACLEHYGYMKITRLQGTGRLLEFERLK